MLRDMVEIFGSRREATLARELTKRFETVYHGTLEALAARVAEDADTRRGEIVIIVAGHADLEADGSDELERVLKVLLAELPLKQAVGLAVKLTGAPRNLAYELAIDVNRGGPGRSNA
jgi:16S rRNA (cytidine1402-2'-O)-methyltransferase